jgi:hypothetical protein
MEFRMSETAASPSALSLSEILDEDGKHLAGQKLPVPATFTFIWRGTRFRGELSQHMPESSDDSEAIASDDLIFTIRADLGPVPYSSENAIGRDQVFDFARRSDTGTKGSQRISAKKRLEYTVKTRLPGPAFGIDIMTTAVAVLLQSESYFAHAAAALPAKPSSGPKIYAAERYGAAYH